MEEGSSGSANAPKGGRRGGGDGGGGGGDGGGGGGSDYGSSNRGGRRGGRRGGGGGDSSGYGGSGSGSSGSSNYGSSNTGSYPSGGDKGKRVSASDQFNKSAPKLSTVPGINIPTGDTPKSIGNKGRKAFKTAIWSPRGSGSKRSSAPKMTNNNNNRSSPIKEIVQNGKSTQKKTTKKDTPKPDKKNNDFSSFDSLYYGESKPKSTSKTKNVSEEADDYLFSDPFGVGSGGGASKKKTKTRSIDIDIRMGNAKLRKKVQADKRIREQKKKTSTFHRPAAAMIFDTFDDLEEEMIGEGDIGNGRKAGGSNRASSPFVKNHQKPKQLGWGTGASIVKKNRGGGGSGEDGWF